MKNDLDIKRALELAKKEHWETSEMLTDIYDVYNRGWTDALLFVAKELDLKF